MTRTFLRERRVSLWALWWTTAAATIAVASLLWLAVAIVRAIYAAVVG